MQWQQDQGLYDSGHEAILQIKADIRHLEDELKELQDFATLSQTLYSDTRLRPANIFTEECSSPKPDDTALSMFGEWDIDVAVAMEKGF